MTLQFYCESCEQDQPGNISPIETDDLNVTPWGEITCDACGFIIATMSASERGRLAFVTEEQAAGIVAAAPLLAAVERLAAKEEANRDAD